MLEAGLKEALACRRIVLPCGLAPSPQRNIPEQGKMVHIHLFLPLADPNLPKEQLGSKWSCQLSRPGAPFLTSAVLKAPGAELLGAVGVPGGITHVDALRDVEAGLFAGKRLSLGHGDDSLSSPGTLSKHLGFSCLLLEGCSPGTQLLGIVVSWSSPAPSSVCFVLPPPSGTLLCVYSSFSCPPLLF